MRLFDHANDMKQKKQKLEKRKTPCNVFLPSVTDADGKEVKAQVEVSTKRDKHGVLSHSFSVEFN